MVGRYKAYPEYEETHLGWLSQIPRHWEIKRLKYLGEAIIGLTYSPDEVVNEGEGILVLRSSNVQNKLLSFDDNVYVRKDVPEKLIVKKGDILICARNGSRALIGKNAQIDESATGMTFGAFMSIFRSKYNDYLSKVFNSALFEYQSSSFLTATINQLTTGNLNSFEIPLPSEIERKNIANFLDHETAKIDTLIDKQQQLIKLLKEKRQAVISHAVTKGLNPAAPMKDSRYDWLGVVPEHWDIVYSKWLFTERNTKAIDNDEMLTASQKYGVISQNEFMRLENQKVVQVQKGHDILKHVEPNDFVISMRSFQGGIEFCQVRGAVSSAYVPLFPSGIICSSYFKHLFKSTQYVQALQSTTNLVRDGQALRYNNFIQVRLPLPPLQEQKKIAEYLDASVKKIDGLIDKATQGIELLNERRSALISAAVTGKIDVRNWQPAVS